MRVKMVSKSRTVCKDNGFLSSLLLMFAFLSGAPTAVERGRKRWSKGCPSQWAQDMLLVWGGEKQPPSLLVCVCVVGSQPSDRASGSPVMLLPLIVDSVLYPERHLCSM